MNIRFIIRYVVIVMAIVITFTALKKKIVIFQLYRMHRDLSKNIITRFIISSTRYFLEEF